MQFPNPATLTYLPNEHALLDFKRFFSISLSQFLMQQSQVLKPLIHKKSWITHNFMKDDPVHFPGHVTHGLDLYSLTIYPVAGIFKGEKKRQLHRIGDAATIAFNHDLMRSYNGRWGILEQQPGQVNWGPFNLRPWPGSTRLWLWTAVGHGAELLSTYRYRQPLSGSEQFHTGLVGLDGVCFSPGGKDFARVAKELETLALDIDKPNGNKHRKAAILLDWDSLTALSIHPQSKMFNPRACHMNYYGALKRLGFEIDILHSDKTKDLGEYTVVCTGLYDLLDDKIIDCWSRYVEDGGHLIVTLRTATRNPYGHFPEISYGERITRLTGARISGYDVMPQGHEGSIGLIHSNKNISWNTWAEQYEPDDNTKILAEFSDQFYRGSCAAFKKKKKNGTITGIGFDHKQGIEHLVFESLSEEISDLKPLPDHTLFCIRGSLGIFLNYNDHPVSIPESFLQNGKFVVGDATTPPSDLAIIKYD